ncbi:MAG: hypothetical protein ACPGUV_13030 [Polyangiales bacterium]
MVTAQSIKSTTMWMVEELCFEAAQGVDRSLMQGAPLTRLWADGQLLANAVELSSWGGPQAQAIVCSCGIEGCADGGWVAVYGAGEMAVVVPDFAHMAQDDLAQVFGPPPILQQRGCIALSAAQMAQAHAQVPAWPALPAWPPLSKSLVGRILQWDAPLQVLGRLTGPVALRHEDVLAVSSGTPAARMQQLAQCIDACTSSTSPATLEPWPAGCAPIAFYLDGPGHPSWTPLVEAQGQLWLSPAAGWLLR